MSIIFKALKKAEEESKVERVSVKKAQVYHFGSKKFLIVLIGIAVLAASSFAGIYLAKNKTFARLFARPSKKIVEVQPTPAPAVPQPAPASPQAPAVTKQPTLPAISKAPDTAKLNEEAIKQIKDKNYSGAEETLKKAIAQNPNDAALHNHLGLALKNQGKYKDAISSYEKAIKLKPDYHEAMNNIAVAYEMVKDAKKAKNFYKKAISAKPSYAEAHLNYALLLEAEGNIAEAASHYETFLNLSSDEALKNKVSERLKRIKK